MLVAEIGPNPSEHRRGGQEGGNKLSRETKLKAKRDNSVNRNEIEQKVIELFSNDLNLEPAVLRRTANG